MDDDAADFAVVAGCRVRAHKHSRLVLGFLLDDLAHAGHAEETIVLGRSSGGHARDEGRGYRVSSRGFDSAGDESGG